MACRFVKVSEKEIKEALFYPSDLVNTKTTMPLRVGEEQWIYIPRCFCVSVYIHYSPPFRGIKLYIIQAFTSTNNTPYLFIVIRAAVIFNYVCSGITGM